MLTPYSQYIVTIDLKSIQSLVKKLQSSKEAAKKRAAAAAAAAAAAYDDRDLSEDGEYTESFTFVLL